MERVPVGVGSQNRAFYASLPAHGRFPRSAAVPSPAPPASAGSRGPPRSAPRTAGRPGGLPRKLPNRPVPVHQVVQGIEVLPRALLRVTRHQDPRQLHGDPTLIPRRGIRVRWGLRHHRSPLDRNFSRREGLMEPWQHDCSATQTEKSRRSPLDQQRGIVVSTAPCRDALACGALREGSPVAGSRTAGPGPTGRRARAESGAASAEGHPASVRRDRSSRSQPGPVPTAGGGHLAGPFS